MNSKKLNILHITCFDNGGAGAAALRLHKALLKLDVESKVLVLEKRTNSPEVYQFKKTNKYFVLFQRVLKNLGFPQTLAHANDNKYKNFKGEFEYFSFAKTDFTDLNNHPLVDSCDLINLHWVPNFIDYASFFRNIKKPIIWTQHDMNAFQGGFHYKEDIERNLHLKDENDEQYNYKQSAISKLSIEALHIVSPSRWMLSEASRSEILGRFNHYYIPNGIDPENFNPMDYKQMKRQLGLDPNKINVLFVAEKVGNIRKGFKYIKTIMKDPTINLKCNFVAVGKVNLLNKVPGVKYLGTIASERTINEIFNAADIFLLPSREDNLPNVMLESLAAGTPIAGFDIGGISDIVSDGVNGFLSGNVSAEGLNEALLKCIDNIKLFDREKISQDLLNNYTTEIQANRYLNLYMSIINNKILCRRR